MNGGYSRRNSYFGGKRFSSFRMAFETNAWNYSLALIFVFFPVFGMGGALQVAARSSFSSSAAGLRMSRKTPVTLFFTHLTRASKLTTGPPSF